MTTPSITDDDEATGFFEPRSRATYSGRNAPSAHGQSPLSVPARSSKRVVKKPVQEDEDGDGMTMLRPAPSSAGVAPRSSARLGADAPSSMIRQHLDAARAAVQTGGYAAIPSQPPPPAVDDKPSERTIALPPSMSPAAGVPAAGGMYNQQPPMQQPPMQQQGFAPVPQAPNTLSGVAYAQSPFSRPGLQQGPASGMVSSHGMRANPGGVTNPGVPSAPAHFMAHRPPQADPPAAVLTAGNSGKARGSWFGAVAAACVAVAAVAAAVAGGRADGLADSTGSLVDPSRGAPRAAARGAEAPVTSPATPTPVAAPIAANPQAPTVSVPVVNMGQSVEPVPVAALDPRVGGTPGQPVTAGQPVAAVAQPVAQQPVAQQPVAQQPVAVAQPQAQLVVAAPRPAPVAAAQPRPAARAPSPSPPSRPAASPARPAAGKGDMDDAAKLLEKAQLEASQSF
jgi:nicotinate-nucleotide--dimethylbenzimidazole phosphoribosyltransferase